MTPEVLQKQMHDAQEHLAPLFGIEKRITFEADNEFDGCRFQDTEVTYAPISEDEELKREFNYDLLKAVLGERTQVVAYIDGRFLIDEDLAAENLPKSAHDMGKSVGFHLYNLANPSL